MRVIDVIFYKCQVGQVTGFKGISRIQAVSCLIPLEVIICNISIADAGRCLVSDAGISKPDPANCAQFLRCSADPTAFSTGSCPAGQVFNFGSNFGNGPQCVATGAEADCSQQQASQVITSPTARDLPTTSEHTSPTVRDPTTEPFITSAMEASTAPVTSVVETTFKQSTIEMTTWGW